MTSLTKSTLPLTSAPPSRFLTMPAWANFPITILPVLPFVLSVSELAPISIVVAFDKLPPSSTVLLVRVRPFVNVNGASKSVPGVAIASVPVPGVALRIPPAFKPENVIAPLDVTPVAATIAPVLLIWNWDVAPMDKYSVGLVVPIPIFTPSS